ncbi:FUSC family protein [Microbacterium betulae]|uniref:FUSC family protein n=1 Tax=Microbacterium betulae TaxID=2981139 RepID=A0AA97FJC3_9MICO|nr:FUSC family protein [Microbacterium sp. AB]WOF23779.1 FUSC family protein [Microbacterium sp. AB]
MTDSAPLTSAVPVPWRRRISPRPGLARVRDSWVAVAQIVVAATGGFLVAYYLLGHETPLLAATVSISSLGLARDARPRRVLETVLGMLTGILVSELLRLAFGSGAWQLGATLAVTMLLARFLMPSPQFAVAAAIQAAIAMVLPVGPLPFMRLADGAIGGVLAVAVTALLPRNPMSAEVRDGRALFAAFDAAAGRVVQGLRRGDAIRADRGLEKARDVQGLVDAWSASLESAQAVSALSPFLRSRRIELQRHARVQRNMDLASRNLRVVARRAAYASRDGEQRPVAADTLAGLQRAAVLVAESLDDIATEPVARETLLAIARRLDPAAMLPGAPQGELALVAAMRPLAVDLLIASGVPRDEAWASIPRV